MTRLTLELARTEPGANVGPAWKFKHSVVIDASDAVFAIADFLTLKVIRLKPHQRAESVKRVEDEAQKIIAAYQVVALEPFGWVAVNVEVGRIAATVTAYATDMHG
jgi:hypothetical protein